MFNSARDDLNDLILGLDLLRDKLSKHEKITQDEWDNCFRRFSMSVLDGNLYQVIKWNEKVERPISPKIKIIKGIVLKRIITDKGIKCINKKNYYTNFILLLIC